MAEVSLLKQTAGTTGTVDTSSDSARFVSIGLGTAAPASGLQSDLVTLDEQGGDPGATADTGKVYTKDVSTITELFYQDSAGNVVQLTSGGSIPAGGGNQITIDDNTAKAFRVYEDGAGDDYIVVNTTDGAETIDLGNAVTVPTVQILGSGAELTIGASGDGRLNATHIDGPTSGTAGVNIAAVSSPLTTCNIGNNASGGSETNIRGKLNVGTATGAANGEVHVQDDIRLGGNIDKLSAALNKNLNVGTSIATAVTIGPSGGTTRFFSGILVDGDTQLEGAFLHNGTQTTDTFAVDIPDNVTKAFEVRQDTLTYIEVITTNGSEVIEFGNLTTDPEIQFNTENAVYLRGLGTAGRGTYLDFMELTADPGATANRGKLYTKDVAGVTELFYQRSDGTTIQLS